MRLKLRHWNKYFFNQLGFQVESFVKSTSVEAHLKDLVTRGVDFKNVFDVGAYKGQWTKSVKRFLPSNTNYFLFEPNTKHNPELEEIGHPYFNFLLGHQDNLSVDFYSVGNTGDSYYKEVNPIYGDENVVNVQMKTLDSVILEFGLPQPDLLKLDTQGSELDILRGSIKTLEHTKAVIVELPISSLNPGAPSIQDTLNFMAKHAFTPVKVTEIHELLGVLVQIDIAFVHDHVYYAIHGRQNQYKQQLTS